jgi:hypothetical protein
MENYSSRKDILLEKLKKIGDLTIDDCSHPDNKISQNARDINRLARECFELIKKSSN